MTKPILPWQMPDHIAELSEIGGSEVIREILTLFLDDVPLRVSRVASAIDGNDAVTVSREGHSLKGGCKQVGADGLAHLAEEWENGAPDPSQWRSLLAAFQREFVEVESLIRSHPLFAE
jgi:HPt (histidine-containing phosphotransfer) domain-containing protein